MKYIFVINPIAGDGKTLKFVNRIKEECIKRAMEYVFEYITPEEDAASIARKYKDEENIIYSVGGEGTMSRLLSGVVGTKNMVGIIPLGSGNDLYKTVVMRNEKIFPVDIAKINDMYFINVACLGIDGDIGNNIGKFRHTIIPNSQIYTASILYTFFKYQFRDVKIEVNDKIINSKFTSICVCNGKYYGGGYLIAPNADITDGHLDIYLAEKLSRFNIIRLILKIKKGKHENSPYVQKMTTDKITLTTDKEVVFNVDGEPFTGNKFEISIIKKGVKLYNDREFVGSILNNS